MHEALIEIGALPHDIRADGDEYSLGFARMSRDRARQRRAAMTEERVRLARLQPHIDAAFGILGDAASVLRSLDGAAYLQDEADRATARDLILTRAAAGPR